MTSTLVENSNHKELKLYVYNVDSDMCREVCVCFVSLSICKIVCVLMYTTLHVCAHTCIYTHSLTHSHTYTHTQNLYYLVILINAQPSGQHYTQQ